MITYAILTGLLGLKSDVLGKRKSSEEIRPIRKIKDKVAIVTGSSRGIGRTIAWHLCKSGAKVVLNGLSEFRLAQTLANFNHAGLKATAYKADVSDMDDCLQLIDHAVEKYGQVDILVNNAGQGSRGFFDHTCPEVFRQLLNVNVLGSVFPTMAALPYLKKTKGSVVFISSLAALRGLPNLCPYSMSKMAQTSLAESLRTELHRYDVHVGIVYANKTKNDPEKRIILPDGSTKTVMKAPPRFVDTQDDVARTLIHALRTRHFKTMVGAKGRTFYYVQKFMPWLVERVCRLELDRIKNDET